MDLTALTGVCGPRLAERLSSTLAAGFIEDLAA